MKVAVVGHIEWSHFLRVDHIPQAGQIVHAQSSWHEAAGGGGIVATQLAQLAGNCMLFTAIGDDEIGRQCLQHLERLGVEVYASVIKDKPSNMAIVHLDSNKERAVTVLGSLPLSGHDTSLPWEKLADADAVYVSAGDAAALKAARQAKVLVATARILPVLQDARVRVDTLVMSENDEDEVYKPGDLQLEPGLVVATNGILGGSTNQGHSYKAYPVPAQEVEDTYGCGDSFVAGLTFGLARHMSIPQALDVASHSGAEAARRRGGHGQLL